MSKPSLKKDLRKGIPGNQSISPNGYLDSFKDNIYDEMSDEIRRMFENGSGGELYSKACAVHSSSMLSYNFFHWINNSHPFVFDDVTYTEVYFEVRMKTLRRSNRPANMDVVLKGQKDGNNQLLFIESKFLEYTENSKFDLSDSYSDSSQWYTDSIKWDSLIENARTLCKDKCYGGGIKQGITHLFGIHSLYNPDALSWFNNNNPKLAISNIESTTIRFANVIFEPRKTYEDEHNAYNSYKELYKAFAADNKEKGLIGISWYSYSNLWEKIKSQIKDTQLVDYILKRYIAYSSYNEE